VIQIFLARLIANKKISVLAAPVAPRLVAAMIGTKLCMAHNRRGAASPIRVVELEPERDEEGETHECPQPNGKEQSRASLASGSGKLQLIEATPRLHASSLPPRRMVPTVCNRRINGIALQSKLASPLKHKMNAPRSIAARLEELINPLTHSAQPVHRNAPIYW
jgi:hypothetical protein